MKRKPVLLTILALGACAQPFEGRIAAKLEVSGIPRPVAECMARRWVDRLSLLQLRRIEQLSGEVGRRYRGRGLTMASLVTQFERLDDPEILRVVTSSAALCALAG